MADREARGLKSPKLATPTLDRRSSELKPVGLTDRQALALALQESLQNSACTPKAEPLAAGTPCPIQPHRSRTPSRSGSDHESSAACLAGSGKSPGSLARVGFRPTAEADDTCSSEVEEGELTLEPGSTRRCSGKAASTSGSCGQAGGRGASLSGTSKESDQTSSKLPSSGTGPPLDMARPAGACNSDVMEPPKPCPARECLTTAGKGRWQAGAGPVLPHALSNAPGQVGTAVKAEEGAESCGVAVPWSRPQPRRLAAEFVKIGGYDLPADVLAGDVAVDGELPVGIDITTPRAQRLAARQAQLFACFRGGEHVLNNPASVTPPDGPTAKRSRLSDLAEADGLPTATPRLAPGAKSFGPQLSAPLPPGGAPVLQATGAAGMRAEQKCEVDGVSAALIRTPSPIGGEAPRGSASSHRRSDDCPVDEAATDQDLSASLRLRIKVVLPGAAPGTSIEGVPQKRKRPAPSSGATPTLSNAPPCAPAGKGVGAYRSGAKHARKRAKAEAQAIAGGTPGSPRRSGRVAALEALPIPNLTAPSLPSLANAHIALDADSPAPGPARKRVSSTPGGCGARAGSSVRLGGQRRSATAAWGIPGPGCPLPSPARRLRGDRLNRSEWDADEEAWAWQAPALRPRASALLAACDRSRESSTPVRAPKACATPPTVLRTGAELPAIVPQLRPAPPVTLRVDCEREAAVQRMRHMWEFSSLERDAGAVAAHTPTEGDTGSASAASRAASGSGGVGGFIAGCHALARAAGVRRSGGLASPMLSLASSSSSSLSSTSYLARQQRKVQKTWDDLMERHALESGAVEALAGWLAERAGAN